MWLCVQGCVSLWLVVVSLLLPECILSKVSILLPRALSHSKLTLQFHQIITSCTGSSQYAQNLQNLTSPAASISSLSPEEGLAWTRSISVAQTSNKIMCVDSGSWQSSFGAKQQGHLTDWHAHHYCIDWCPRGTYTARATEGYSRMDDIPASQEGLEPLSQETMNTLMFSLGGQSAINGLIGNE